MFLPISMKSHPDLSNTNYDENVRPCHFDRRATKWPEVEKSVIKPDFPSGLYASLRVSTPLRYTRNDSKSALIKSNWYKTSFSNTIRYCENEGLSIYFYLYTGSVWFEVLSLVSDNSSFDHINYILSDVCGVVCNTLQVA